MGHVPEPGALHLIAGSTGAGKSTYAARLAAAEGAVTFGLDAWMGRLFWMDAVPGEDAAWAMARIARCTVQMQDVIAQVAPLGLPCVVDAGFTTRTERMAFADWGRARGLAVRLHWLDVAPEVRWARVEARNAAGGGETGFVVTRAMFDYVEGLWEAPGPEECAALRISRVEE